MRMHSILKDCSSLIRLKQKGCTGLWGLVLLFCFFTSVSADKVCTFTYQGQLKNLHDSAIIVPEEMVGFYTEHHDPATIDLPDSISSTSKNLFPLIGMTTPMKLTVESRTSKESITAFGDTIETEDEITSDINFNITIQDDADDLSDSFSVQCWDRELGLYYHNNRVSFVNEIMKPLELRFSYNPGDADYHYTKADIEIVTTAGSVQDREIFTLKKNGTRFSETFPLRVATPSPGNHKIEVNANDTIVLSFRNSENVRLLRDTIKGILPFALLGSMQVLGACYFDNNGDRFVDSIFVEAKTDITGGFTDNIVKEAVEAAIKLPAYRKFTIYGSGALANGFYISVTEKTEKPTPEVNDEDKLEVVDYQFSSGGMLQKTTRNITFFAPVKKVAAWKWDNLHFSVGVGMGLQFNNTKKVNTLIEDIWTEMKKEHIGSILEEKGTPKMILSHPVRLKVLVSILPFLSVETFGQFSWSKKFFKVEGGSDFTASMHNYSVIGGIHAWFRLLQMNDFSLKAGIGGCGAYSKLKVTDDIGNADIKGPGYIGNILLGGDLKLGRFSVFIDIIGYLGINKYTHRHNYMITKYSTIGLPEEDKIKGMGICPGFIFHF